MAALPEEELLPFRILADAESSAGDSSSSNPTDAVLFFGVCLVLGIACRHLLRGTRVPYTVALLVLGIALGSIEYGTHHHLGKIGDGIRLLASIDPDFLLAVFLPALFSMEIHQIKRCIMQMILLAGPGVLISTFCLGTALKLIFPYNWNWKTCLLLGGLLSATDPVAIVALLKELGASKKLSTIIEGESLMNDGIAIVVYQLFFQIVLGKSFNWAAIIKFLTEVSLSASCLWNNFCVMARVYFQRYSDRNYFDAGCELHRLLHGDSDVASTVINESEAEGEAAKKFLEDIRVTFPQVLCGVKTRQVAFFVLNHLIDYVKKLEKDGLLEEIEILHLHDAVQSDLKKLLTR